MMTTPMKKLGIWMDHSSARLMEISGTPVETRIITSQFTHDTKVQSLGKGENLMHNKEQHQQSDYYKKLKESILHFDEVLLFGPTTAKNELANLMKDDHLFAKKRVEVRDADKMTENQQHAFVKEYFSESHITGKTNAT